MISFASSSHHVKEKHGDEEVNRVGDDEQDDLVLDVEQVDERCRRLRAALNSCEVGIETLPVRLGRPDGGLAHEPEHHVKTCEHNLNSNLGGRYTRALRRCDGAKG